MSAIVKCCASNFGALTLFAFYPSSPFKKSKHMSPKPNPANAAWRERGLHVKHGLPSWAPVWLVWWSLTSCTAIPDPGIR